MKFSRDAPKRKVIKALESLGFRVVRVGKHISVELSYEIISGINRASPCRT